MSFRRFFCLLCTLALTAGLLCAPLSASADGYPLSEDITLTAKGAIVLYMDASVSGEEAVRRGADSILFEKNADERFAPGALNRLALGLTAMQFIERKNINVDTATGTYNSSLQANHVWGTGLATANLLVGDKWSIRDLLAISMIQTAADASVALAHTLGGSVQLFVDEMNATAAALGCTNTHFTNVTGADDPDQYTTARDSYKLLRRALDYKLLEDMMSVTSHAVDPPVGYGGEWPNTNYLLRQSSDYYYEPAVLGKTGAADNAYSLASVASADGYRYLVVAGGCPESGAHFDDSIALYRWAFRNFSYKTIIPAGQPITRVGVKYAWSADTINLVAKHALSCLVISDLDENTVTKNVILYEDKLDKDGKLVAPIDRETAVGKVELFIRTDQKIGEVELVTAESIKRSELLYLLASLGAFFSSPWFWLGVGLLALLIFAYAVLLVRYNQGGRGRRRSKKKSRFRR